MHKLPAGRAEVPGGTAATVPLAASGSVKRYGEDRMKLSVLFPALCLVPLLAAGPAESKSSQKRPNAQVASVTTANASGIAAMNECQARYAGNRGYLGKDRYAYIEGCVRQMTGRTPADMQLNCALRKC
jgi:hypothetical protein